MFKLLKHISLKCNNRILQLILLFLVAFSIRAGVFHFFIQPYSRYQQPDSVDYHCCALSITAGYGMYRIDNKKPIFWRTPGYPLFLAFFYRLYGLRDTNFRSYTQAHTAALWVQIALCSLIPLLVLWLALLITSSYFLALIAAWISALHPGLVLGSTYLLTDALGTLLFLLFLILFFIFWKQHTRLLFLFLAALALAIFTWIRPLGQALGILTVVILLFKQTSFKNKLLYTALFSTLFFGALSPWYIRNYRLCGSIFFCPLWGPYAQAFIAPKIRRRFTGEPLEKSIQYFALKTQAAIIAHQQKNAKKQAHFIVCPELIAATVVTPYIFAHPFYALKDWLKEITKTAFDLYASQLVAFINNTFTWDPPEEFLGEKLALCLYKQSMPLSIRFICWLEFIYTLILWLGFIFYLAVIGNLLIKKQVSLRISLSLMSILFIALTIGLTGGFGYARLRMPVEALLLILSLMGWQSIIFYKKGQHVFCAYE